MTTLDNIIEMLYRCAETRKQLVVLRDKAATAVAAHLRYAGLRAKVVAAHKVECSL